MVDSNGILYIATGEQFVEEAILSAETVTEQMPETSIALITDTERQPAIFDEIIQIDEPDRSFSDQIKYLSQTPFERTLCLDTDIYMDAPVHDVFPLLDEFDVAAAHAHDRSQFDVPGVPESFPEYNTGVLAYRNTDRFSQFLASWQEYYTEFKRDNKPHNQPSFRKALFHSDLRVATLTPEYNLMVRFPGHAVGTVRIFHGRLLDIDTPGAGMYDDIPTAAHKINSQEGHRVFTQLGGLSIHSNEEGQIFNRIRMGIYRHGVQGALKKGIKKLIN